MGATPAIQIHPNEIIANDMIAIGGVQFTVIGTSPHGRNNTVLVLQTESILERTGSAFSHKKHG